MIKTHSTIIVILLALSALALGSVYRSQSAPSDQLLEISPLDESTRVMTVHQARHAPAEQTFRYRLTKYDSRPIQIKLQQLSCGCLAAQVDAQQLRQGETIRWEGMGTKLISLRMRTPQTTQDFSFNFSLAVTGTERTNAVSSIPLSQERLSTIVSASGRLRVLPDITIEPPVVRCTLSESPAPVEFKIEQTVLLHHPNPSPPTIDALPPWLALKAIHAGQFTKGKVGKRQSWTVVLEMLPDQIEQRQYASTARPIVRWQQPDDGKPQESTFTVMATPGGVLAAETVVLKPIRDSLPAEHVRVPLRSIDGTEFCVSRVSTQSSCVTVEIEKQPRGNLQWIKLTANHGQAFEEVVRVETDHPQRGILSIRVVSTGSPDSPKRRGTSPTLSADHVSLLQPSQRP